jgi:uncharacterized membrane protein YtjA (UPF0391 family)
MQRHAVDFFIVAITAAILGLGDITGAAAWIAKMLFIVFLFLAIVGFLKKFRLTDIQDIHDAGRRNTAGVIYSSDTRVR